MSRVPAVRRADLDRSIAALKSAGLTVTRVEINPGGQVVILTGNAGEPQGGASVSALDNWRSKRDARAAQGS